MERVNGVPVYWLGLVVGSLRDRLVAGVRVGDIRGHAVNANLALREFQRTAIPSFKLSGGAANAVIDNLAFITGQPASPHQPPTVSPDETEISLNILNVMVHNLDHFQSLLVAELQNLNVYFVSSKLGYDTDVLIAAGEQVLPPATVAQLPGRVRDDVREATRCIAFQLWTASGFHLMRAVESVMREYFVLPSFDAPKTRNWGTYIEALAKGGLDRKLVARLDRLREYERNELMHVETVLDENSAPELFDYAKGIISALLRDLGERRGSRGVESP